ncbi:3994_t:CDS:2, partial [Funneliformis geosporum]
VFGVLPYVDPKRFDRQRKNDNTFQPYMLNKKSDVYSVGVLLWEISSGRPPFYVKGEEYDFTLAMDIIQGLRESVIPGTPEFYVNIYTECWDGEPENRPAINKIVDSLNATLTKINIFENEQINEESNIQLMQSRKLKIEYLSDTPKEFDGDIDGIVYGPLLLRLLNSSYCELLYVMFDFHMW